ncbi:TPA: hypothetical protein ACKP22_002129 [Pseudomonas putida]
MQFAVALIEYLISGIAASAWMLAILREHYPTYFAEVPWSTLKDYKEIIILIYLPIIYVLGIYVDATSSYLIRRGAQVDEWIDTRLNRFSCQRDRVLSLWQRLVGPPKKHPYGKTAEIIARSAPDAVRAMETYVSRDRIARGVAFNAFIGGLTALFYAPQQHKLVIFVACAITFMYSSIMHNRLSRLSSQFKKVVLLNLQAQTPATPRKNEHKETTEA